MALTKVVYTDGETVIHSNNLNDIQDEIISNAANIEIKVNKISGSSLVPDTKVAAYDSHIADSTIHVTSDDKTNWNGKLDSTGGNITNTLTIQNNTILTSANYDSFFFMAPHKSVSLDSGGDLNNCTDYKTRYTWSYGVLPNHFVKEVSTGGGYTMYNVQGSWGPIQFALPVVTTAGETKGFIYFRSYFNGSWRTWERIDMTNMTTYEAS